MSSTYRARPLVDNEQRTQPSFLSGTVPYPWPSGNNNNTYITKNAPLVRINRNSPYRNIKDEIRIHNTFTCPFSQRTALFPLGVANTARLQEC